MCTLYLQRNSEFQRSCSLLNLLCLVFVRIHLSFILSYLIGHIKGFKLTIPVYGSKYDIVESPSVDGSSSVARLGGV